MSFLRLKSYGFLYDFHRTFGYIVPFMARPLKGRIFIVAFPLFLVPAEATNPAGQSPMTYKKIMKIR